MPRPILLIPVQTLQKVMWHLLAVSSQAQFFSRPSKLGRKNYWVKLYSFYLLMKTKTFHQCCGQALSSFKKLSMDNLNDWSIAKRLTPKKTTGHFNWYVWKIFSCSIPALFPLCYDDLLQPQTRVFDLPRNETRIDTSVWYCYQHVLTTLLVFRATVLTCIV